MKYSIVIPVYNAEKYLPSCIESIAHKSNDIEIVLVNDGSRDASGKLCDGFSEKYSFIKSFHIENGGAGNARNYGASKATGDYIIFVDADDSLSDGFIRRFMFFTFLYWKL